MQNNIDTNQCSKNNDIALLTEALNLGILTTDSVLADKIMSTKREQVKKNITMQ